MRVQDDERGDVPRGPAAEPRGPADASAAEADASAADEVGSGAEADGLVRREALPLGAARDDVTTAGPGLHGSGWDPAASFAIGFAVAGLTPTQWFLVSLGEDAFGPIPFPVILAIVGVFAALVTLLRFTERAHTPSRNTAVAALALGLVRILVFPMLGW